MRLTAIRDKIKQIFSSGGLRLLQMVLELDTGWCSSEVNGPQGVDCEVSSEDNGPQGVDCEVSHRLERGTRKPLPNMHILKP